MQIRFWGVRGSIPTPGSGAVRYGGNTSCVEVEAGPSRLILDAGTGLRLLGDAAASQRGSTREYTLFLSHLHWDHIQGLPFFKPLYQESTKIRIYGPRVGEGSLTEILNTQMRPPGFPVRLTEFGARIEFHELGDGDAVAVGDVRVTTARLNHPGGVLGYRVEWQDRALAYATDTEHYSCPDPKLVALARRADTLIYDAMYLPEEYRGDVGYARVGWGHSTFEAGAAVARAAGVGRLVLFHHDPARTDTEMDQLVDRASRHFAAVSAAREGTSIELVPVDPPLTRHPPRAEPRAA